MNPLSKLISRIALPAIAALSACTTTPGNHGPTFEDYLSIEDAMNNYHYGLDNDDAKVKASAFADNGRIVSVIGGKELLVEYPHHPEKNTGAIPGAPAGGSPPSGPPAGAASGPKGELWHLTYPGHFKFESATRVTHYSYWTSLYSEAKGPRDSQVGSPGHYEDILEKQSNGQWLFVERKIVVGSK